MLKSDASRSIGDRTGVGAAWLIGARLSTKALDFITLTVLARLLTPADFGIVAIAMSLIFIVEALFELPISTVLIRISTIERSHLDTAFTIGVIRGLGLASVLIGGSFIFASVYGDSRLIPMICVLSLAPAMRGLVSPAMARFIQQLNFKPTFLVDLVGKAISVPCSVVLALYTHSYWSIIAGTVMTPLSMLVASYIIAPYRPRLSLIHVRLFIDFLGWTTASQLLAAVNWQVDRLFLGRFVAPARLGAFTLATDLAGIPELAIIKPVGASLTSAFTSLRDDMPRLRRAYLNSAGAVLTVGIPIMISVSVLANPIVRIFLGQRWLAIVPLMQWVAAGMLPMLMAAPLNSLAMALGRTRILTIQTAVDFAFRGPLIFIGAFLYQEWGVVWMRMVVGIIGAVVALILVQALTGLKARTQLLSFWRPALGGLVHAAVLFFIEPFLAGFSSVGLVIATALTVGLASIAYMLTLATIWSLAGKPQGVESMILERINPSRFAR